MPKSSPSNREPTPKRTAPTHNLRHNAISWTPPSIIVFDTETVQHETEDVVLQSLRCWVAVRIDRRQQRRRPPGTYGSRGTTADSLARWIVESTAGTEIVWAYAHNLQFDIVVAGLPQRITALGWTITDFSFGGKSCWFRFANGKKRITLADSWSVLPYPLAKVGAKCDIPKLALPDNDDSLNAWFDRCEQDVRITASALLDLMIWWDRKQLGKWDITGPSCGTHAMRHRLKADHITIDPDPKSIALDRKAIWGGRRDGTRCGSWFEHLFANIDFVAAYPTIAAHLPLPRKRGPLFSSLPINHHWIDHDHWGVIAEVEVETDVPRYPLRENGATYYPVGRFVTTLCSPEIIWARDSGHLRRIGPGRLHFLSNALRDWAQWVLRVQHGEEPDTPPVAELAAKLWSRSVLGGFAARGRRATRIGPALHPSWHVERAHDHTTDTKAAVIDMFGDRWWVGYDVEGDNSYPAIFAWAESHVRMRLGKMLEWLGDTVWCSCDTDGCIIDLDAAAHAFPGRARGRHGAPVLTRLAENLCGELEALTWPLVPRLKGVSHNLVIHGPQHIITDDERKLAGIHRGAEQVSETCFAGINWPGLSWQITHGDMRGFINPKTVWTVPAVTLNRFVAKDGTAVPVLAGREPGGPSQLSSWPDTAWNQWGIELAHDQSVAVRHLL